MRRLFYTPSGLELRTDVPEPQIVKPDDVKIKISYCGVCGSDLHFLRKEMDYLVLAESDHYPLGHEASGIITELGPEATAKGLKVGDKVIYYYNEHCGKCHYCRNGQEHLCTNMKVNMMAMSDYLVTGEQTVFKLDDDTDMAKAVFHEPISVCLHGIDLARIKPGNTVLISGGGAIGMILLQLAKLSGAAELTMSEPIAWKREQAKKFGAVHTIDPVNESVAEKALEYTDGLGYDVVIEASGSVRACPAALEAVGRGGTLEFFAALYDVNYNFPLNLQAAFFKEVTIIGGVFQSPYAFPRTMRLFKCLDIDGLMSENCIFPVENAQEAFEAQMNGKTIKSIIKF
jgi:L-iditol 2-dehydrogenase